MKLLDTQIVTTEFRVSHQDLERRLIHQALEEMGMLDEQGNRKPGVGAVVNVYGDRRTHNHGFAVRITRDLSKSTDKRLPAPGAEGAA